MGRGTPHRGMVSPSTWICWGIWRPVRAYRFSAKNVPYLKKPRSSRLKITDWATNHRAFRSLSRYFSTSRPWV